MRIQPQQKNIRREKENSFKTDVARKDNTQEVENKINAEFGFLTDVIIEQSFTGPINEVFFGIVEIIDKVARSDRKSSRQYNKK
jgi:hypothetical protein